MGVVFATWVGVISKRRYATVDNADNMLRGCGHALCCSMRAKRRVRFATPSAVRGG